MNTRTRLRRTTTRLDNGTTVTKTKLVPRAVQEYEIQAEAVRRLRKMPEFDKRFTLAGDMAAGKRSRQGATIAKATGLVPGDPDLRLYLEGGRLCMIEFKAGKGRESTEQVDRIALLDTLGFTVVVVKANTAAEGAERTVELVQGWLGEQVALNHGHNAPQIDREASPAAETTLRAGQVANDNSGASVGLKMVGAK